MERKSKVLKSALFGLAFTLSLTAPLAYAATEPSLYAPTLTTSTNFIPTTDVTNTMNFAAGVQDASNAKIDLTLDIWTVNSSNNLINVYSKKDTTGYLSTSLVNATWNGRDNNGAVVADGTYNATLKSTNHDTNVAGNSVQFSNFTVSKKAPTLSYTTVAPTTYNTNSLVPFTVNYDLNLGTATTADVTLVIDSTVAVSESLATTGGTNKVLTWNGMINGSKVANGPHNFYLTAKGDTAHFGLKSADLTGIVTVSDSPIIINTYPAISNVVVNPTTYHPNTDGNVSLKYDLSKSSPNTHITAAVYSTADVNTPIKQWVATVPTTTTTTAATTSLTWDGKSAANPTQYVANGTYFLKVWGDEAGTALTSVKSSDFTISTTTTSLPIVSGLNVNPNPYNPKNGSANLNYSIDNSNAVLILQVLNSSNGVVSQWTNIQPSTGTNSKVWSADTNLAAGTYTFKVSGTSNNQNLVTQQTSFTVSNTTSTNCAGFTDISATDANCNAYSWVKAEGIFTGNPNGTFDPNGILQRDQVAKVVLEAFGKYSSGTEYCQAGNPFADVTTASWARQYICLGKKTMVNGVYLLTGYKSGPNAGLFLPANPVNRSEFLAIVLRNLSVSMPADSTYSYADVPVNQWDSGYAAYAAQHLTSVYPQSNLNRTQSVSRLEAARVLYALHNQGSL